MKKMAVAFMIFGLLIACSAPVSAEQKRTVWDMDRLSVLPSNQVRALFGFSALTSIQEDHSWITNMPDVNTFQSVLSPCSNFPKIDPAFTACIDNFSYRKVGASVWQNAVLSKVQLGAPTRTIPKGNAIVGPLTFLSDAGTFRPDGDKSTFWTLAGSPHRAGVDYLLRARFIGNTSDYGQAKFKMELMPVSYPNGKTSITQDEITFEEFSKGYEYKVRLQLGAFVKTMTGWFFGRITNPTVVRSFVPGHLEISGEPAFVPIGITNDIPVAEADKYFDPVWCEEVRKKTNGPCGSINRLYDKAFTFTNEEGSDPDNLGRWEAAPGGVRTIATLSSWSLDSSFFYQMNADKPALKCLTELYGSVWARAFQGAVFSNATIFQVNPPIWDEVNKSFVFKVASPHLDESGAPNKGFYTLFIPTEMAKCRWGGAASSAKAEIQIVNSDGKVTSTTIAASTENGNLRFNVAGFGYSSPTIKIRMGSNVGKILEPMTSTPKAVVQTTIKCVKGKTVKKVVAVKPTCPKGYKQVPA
jgi:hypothetical protein